MCQTLFPHIRVTPNGGKHPPLASCFLVCSQTALPSVGQNRRDFLLHPRHGLSLRAAAKLQDRKPPRSLLSP